MESRTVWDRIAVAILAVAACATLVACASIVNGTTQDIGISSQPGGATVTVNGVVLGQTPLIADLKRKNEHFVTIELEGFEPYELTITKSASGWVFGNILFGGLIGLAVDAISGGLYKLSPESINAEMITATTEGEGVFITVVLAPEPGWIKIGEMESATPSLEAYYGLRH